MIKTLRSLFAQAPPRDATPDLVAAVLARNVPEATRALASGADPDAVIDPPQVRHPRRVLQQAVLYNDLDLAGALLSAGASLDATTPTEWARPLRLAVAEQSRDMVQLLHAYDADWDVPDVDPIVGEPMSAFQCSQNTHRAGFSDWVLALTGGSRLTQRVAATPARRPSF